MSARMSSWLFAPNSFCSDSQRSHEIDSGATLSVASAWSSSCSPSAADSFCCRPFRKWRMRERALPVATNDSHDGFGRADGEVRIST